MFSALLCRLVIQASPRTRNKRKLKLRQRGGSWRGPAWLSPRLESLEDRRLLAVAVTDAPAFNITLDAADSVVVNVDGSKVRVVANGTATIPILG